jgi:DNA-binding CsgD family transcriptional regulator
LPPLKRRGLVLMAFGFGPAELADRLGLCLERAEALHEELTRKLGLDRIARQVRSAIRAGLIDPIGRPPGKAPDTPPRGKR